MKKINYLKADNVDEALQLLYENGENIKIIAGGTDLLVRLKDDLIKESTLLDISKIDDLKGIYEDNEYIHILPLTTHTELIESKIIGEYGYILSDACKTIGSPQIRNRATVGGNIMNASPAGDSIPALYAMEANIKLKGISGERVINIEEFFSGPGKTQIRKGEMLVDIFFQKSGNNETGFFNKLGQRNAMAIAVASVVVRLSISDNNRFDNAFVAFGAVAPTVVRGRLIEKALTESNIDSLDKLLYISRLAFREVSPITDVRGSDLYRKDMCINLLYEGLVELFMNGWRR